MSNQETAPQPLACESHARPEPPEARGRLLEPRDVPLGGPRAMTVRRTLPQRAQSLIGAWCFLDHYGPDDVAQSGGMEVPGHPHTGLQTVSWLFAGEVDHLDSIGTRERVRPGQMNLMTAGSGIAHSEYSTPETTVLHGAQLWVALPDRDRFTAPAFEHYTPAPIDVDGARVLVFLGSLCGATSPVTTFSRLLGAEVMLRPGQVLDLDVKAEFEHGVLVDTGEVTAAGIAATPSQLVYQAPGHTTLRLQATGAGPARVLVLGGEPLGEQILMWWNFVGRTQEEITAFRDRWQLERGGDGEVEGAVEGEAGSEAGSGVPSEAGSGAPSEAGSEAGAVGRRQFGEFPEDWAFTLPAPELPNVRLKLRG